MENNAMLVTVSNHITNEPKEMLIHLGDLVSHASDSR